MCTTVYVILLHEERHHKTTVAYNIMYNAHVHVHMDMYIKGCKHIQCTCIHVYTCTYIVYTAVG